MTATAAKETVLITGASAGIGRELARLFAADGADLVLVARRRDRLDELSRELSDSHGVGTTVIAQDLSTPDAVNALVAELDATGSPIDVLVNNAGFGANGPFADLDLEMQSAMVRLNVTTLMELTGRLLPRLTKARGGILNVASTAGFQPGPRMGVYYATKAFVLSFSEALHEETRGTGLTVTCLCPGPTRTEFLTAAGMEEPLMFRIGAASALSVAKAGHRGFRKGRAVVIPGFSNKLAMLLVRLTPRRFVRKIVKRLQ
ncbi:MAG: short-chain dehydrogenase [Planctomycetes bacterium]|nr:short-chain dehydrogenase [Planctomycetota bacterium]